MRAYLTASATLLAASLVGCAQDTFGTTNDAATGDDMIALSDAGVDAMTKVDCGDPQTNPENCGACGHRCLGGDCDSGTCMPVTLATNQAPYLIAVDNDGVYWTSQDADGGVTRADKDGGAQRLISKHRGAEAIAVSQGYVYYSGGSYNARVSTDGGAASDVLASLFTHDLAVDSFLFGATEDIGANGFSRRDLSLANDVASTNQGGAPSGIAIDATQVYLAMTGEVRSFRRSDFGHVGSVTGQSKPEGIAVDDTYVFWTDNTQGAVLRAATSLGGSVAIADSLNNPHRIALDAKYVYWVNGGGLKGTVMRADKGAASGNRPKVLFSGPPGPRGIAVDDEAVYWTNEASGDVMKIAKPLD